MEVQAAIALQPQTSPLPSKVAAPRKYAPVSEANPERSEVWMEQEAPRREGTSCSHSGLESVPVPLHTRQPQPHETDLVLHIMAQAGEALCPRTHSKEAAGLSEKPPGLSRAPLLPTPDFAASPKMLTAM